jgi:hypothetical protein
MFSKLRLLASLGVLAIRVGAALAPRLPRTAAPDGQRDEPSERSRQLLHNGLAVVPEHAR